ncbi:MAG: mechanosensitive ion channel, partial [Gammaproteobacteria bacterium]|nr:mechanosensitive ion channel [Gammaproteobacteria bacterium]
MESDKISPLIEQAQESVYSALAQPETYSQFGIIVGIYAVAFVLANRIRRFAPFLDRKPEDIEGQPLRIFVNKLGNLIFPLLAIMMLRISVEISQSLLDQGWLVQTALTIAILLLFNSIINDFISNSMIAGIFRYLGIPLLFLHLVGILEGLIEILESMSVSIGNIEISAYGVARVAIFGSMLFWIGRVSNRTGREIISRQANLDVRTREVASKLLEITVFFVIFLLLLQVMGINLTALAVFGGAIGVGLGFGLQAIASNFISGIIILLDRSLAIGDYVEFEDDKAGVVREMNMRSTTLETYDGRDIMVPNEKFIVETFINWTHKDKRQRYRVDFSVAYSTDVGKLVDIIKEVVASHPQVISGDDVPIEERPDCEIDSFGDSGINMFVEFWMLGIDDGKNRVGGDLLLM